MTAEPACPELLQLAEQRLSVLINQEADPVSTLDAVLKRLFDPAEPLTVCAFASSL